MNNQEPIYIISDVHGCMKTLEVLVKKLPKDAKLVFVGDLIDRGVNSKDVVEFVKSNNYDCVLGNHENYMIESMKVLLNQPEFYNKSKWFINLGGKDTLNSYGNIDDLSSNLQFLKHLEWLETLPLYLEYKDHKIQDRYLVVSHSHIVDKWQYRNHNLDSDEYKSFKETILSSRYKKYDNKNIFNVFGHTPIENEIIENYRASIDLGCVFDNKVNLKGYLCALEFPSLKIYKQTKLD